MALAWKIVQLALILERAEAECTVLQHLRIHLFQGTKARLRILKRFVNWQVHQDLATLRVEHALLQEAYDSLDHPQRSGKWSPSCNH